MMRMRVRMLRMKLRMRLRMLRMRLRRRNRRVGGRGGGGGGGGGDGQGQFGGGDQSGMRMRRLKHHKGAPTPAMPEGSACATHTRLRRCAVLCGCGAVRKRRCAVLCGCGGCGGWQRMRIEGTWWPAGGQQATGRGHRRRRRHVGAQLIAPVPRLRPPLRPPTNDGAPFLRLLAHLPLPLVLLLLLLLVVVVVRLLETNHFGCRLFFFYLTLMVVHGVLPSFTEFLKTARFLLFSAKENRSDYQLTNPFLSELGRTCCPLQHFEFDPT